MGRVIALAAALAGLSAAVASVAGPTDLRAGERYVARHCNAGSRGSTTTWVRDRSFHFNALYGETASKSRPGRYP